MKMARRAPLHANTIICYSKRLREVPPPRVLATHWMPDLINDADADGKWFLLSLNRFRIPVNLCEYLVRNPVFTHRHGEHKYKMKMKLIALRGAKCRNIIFNLLQIIWISPNRKQIVSNNLTEATNRNVVLVTRTKLGVHSHSIASSSWYWSNSRELLVVTGPWRIPNRRINMVRRMTPS